MKIQKNIYSKGFLIFIAAMALLSVIGGYKLSQLIYKMNDYYLQRTENILAMERNLADATISLGRQVQEWKDMLLRINNTEQYNKHRQAFYDSHSAVEEALIRTKLAMEDAGMDTDGIEQLLTEHQSLRSDYVFAKSVLKPQHIDSSFEVDKLVIGVDRKLQQHIARVKTDIQQFSNKQLKLAMPSQENPHMLGLLGGLSLLIMSLTGFVFAVRYNGREN